MVSVARFMDPSYLGTAGTFDAEITTDVELNTTETDRAQQDPKRIDKLMMNFCLWKNRLRTLTSRRFNDSDQIDQYGEHEVLKTAGTSILLVPTKRLLNLQRCA